jgi:hypothetical protein
MTITTAGALSSTAIIPVASQTSVTNGDGISGAPAVGLADNPTVPGTGAILIPSGTTAEQPAGINGKFRYNVTESAFEGYSAGQWRQFSLAGGVTQVDTGTGLTGGPITGVGTISIASTAVSAGSYGSSTQVGSFTVNAQGQLTAAANVTITPSGIGAVASVSGTANEVTATGTSAVTISLPAALTFTGKTVTGGAFNATSMQIGSVDVVTTSASQTLTNKTINASNNTLSNIGVAAGGTGLYSYTTGDTLYASNSSTLSKLALGTQGYVLTASPTGPTWSGINGGTF